MPITILHAPLFGILFLMAAIPGLLSLLLLLVPGCRRPGRRLFTSAVGGAAGIVAYQFAYLPVLALGLLSAFLLGRYPATKMLGAVVTMLFFYVFWFVFLFIGYVSGFRAGERYASGLSLRESVQNDFLIIWHRRARSPDA